MSLLSRCMRNCFYSFSCFDMACWLVLCKRLCTANLFEFPLFILCLVLFELEKIFLSALYLWILKLQFFFSSNHYNFPFFCINSIFFIFLLLEDYWYSNLIQMPLNLLFVLGQWFFTLTLHQMSSEFCNFENLSTLYISILT